MADLSEPSADVVNYDPSRRYWCYNCHTYVLVQTLPNSTLDVCSHCMQRSLLPVRSSSHPLTYDVTSLESRFFHALNAGDDEFYHRELNMHGHELVNQDFTLRAGVLINYEDNEDDDEESDDDDDDVYDGNPGDYLDDEEFEDFVADLVDNDNGETRGAPPASKLVIDSLSKESVSVDEECAVCKDNFDVGALITKLPCGHGYHEECIVHWLKLRNSCPICRFELETDDADYEESKRSTFGSSS